MKIHTTYLPVKTKGNTDIIDITGDIQDKIDKYDMKEGQVTIFVPGSTGGLTTMEFEPNLGEDIRKAFERLAPEGMDYAHHLTWGDDNGHSHVRASFLGPSLTVPVREKRLTLGTWQQIVFIDFDTSPRTRKLIVQIIGG